MSLPWVRLDTNIGTHDKVLALEADRSPKKWQALWSYAVALGWSGGQGTDGNIPGYALGSVKGTPTTARLLVTYRLWIEAPGGWRIVNYGERQQLTATTHAKAEHRRLAGEKGNCVRWHGPDCWHPERGCSRAVA